MRRIMTTMLFLLSMLVLLILLNTGEVYAEIINILSIEDEGNLFSIQVDTNDKDTYISFSTNKTVALQFSFYQIASIRDALIKGKEWLSIAREKNITGKKEIKTIRPQLISFYYNRVRLADSRYIDFDFDSSSVRPISLYVPRLQAKDNKYIDIESQRFHFTMDMVDEIVDALDTEIIEEKITEFNNNSEYFQ